MSQPVRLLILTHNYPRYDGDYAGVFISLLARRMADHGIEPIVLAPHDRQIEEFEVVDGVKIYRFRYADKPEAEDIAYRGNMQQLVLGSLSGALKFRRFLRCWCLAAFQVIEKERIQVVAGHWLVPTGMVMKTIAAKQPLPMILSSHGTDIRLMKKHGRFVFRYFRKFCASLKKWTVVSSFLKDQILSLDRSLTDIVEILPLPHDETLFYKDSGIQREPNLIVSVTRFTEQKRVDYLIKAFAEVKAINPYARLEIYGTGPRQSEIERLIEEREIKTHVTIFSPVPQEKLREVYNRATVVVLNSYQEGFGLVLSEAMMCGTAVIGTASGGIPDIVKDEETGLLVPLDDSTRLAEAILRLLNNPSLRQKLADNGYHFARANYASDPLAKRYAQMVRESLQ
ncbi:MAG: glycosyltransferase family 4 protein [Candidatus Zixiibacteriota bacterium]